MSASTLTTSTSTPTGSPSPSQSDSSGNQPPSNNNLYLFTFLTTLLLLLAVSCGIVLRSFILRRRFRRRVEAAIAAGVLLPEQVEALRRRGPPVGEKPKIWEVRIDKGQKEGYETSPSSKPFANLEDDDWANIMPVAAAIIPGNASTSSKAKEDEGTEEPGEVSTGRSSRRQPLWPFSRRVAQAPILPTTAPSASHVDAQNTSEPDQLQLNDLSSDSKKRTRSIASDEHDRVQVTVMIAMPNPNARHYVPAAETSGSQRVDSGTVSTAGVKGKEPSTHSHEADDEEEIPEVVFGVTEVRWASGADWKPSNRDSKIHAKGDEADITNP